MNGFGAFESRIRAFIKQARYTFETSRALPLKQIRLSDATIAVSLVMSITYCYYQEGR